MRILSLKDQITKNEQSSIPPVDNKQLRDSINEVLLSELLKKNLDEKECHAEYFRHLKNYQRTICLMNADVI